MHRSLMKTAANLHLIEPDLHRIFNSLHNPLLACGTGRHLYLLSFKDSVAMHQSMEVLGTYTRLAAKYITRKILLHGKIKQSGPVED